MADDPRKLRKLLEILNENNVVSYKDASGMEIVIRKEAAAVISAPSEPATAYSLDEFGESTESKPSSEKVYSEDEMLFWSAGGGI